MRNVWAIAGQERLKEWVTQSGFTGAEIVHAGATTLEEQRSTRWMNFESLDKALDPVNSEQTVEGLPAPRRAVLIARRGRS